MRSVVLVGLFSGGIALASGAATTVVDTNPQIVRSLYAGTKSLEVTVESHDAGPYDLRTAEGRKAFVGNCLEHSDGTPWVCDLRDVKPFDSGWRAQLPKHPGPMRVWLSGASEPWTGLHPKNWVLTTGKAAVAVDAVTGDLASVHQAHRNN